MISVKINYSPSTINHSAVPHPCCLCLPASQAVSPSRAPGENPFLPTTVLPFILSAMERNINWAPRGPAKLKSTLY